MPCSLWEFSPGWGIPPLSRRDAEARAAQEERGPPAAPLGRGTSAEHHAPPEKTNRGCAAVHPPEAGTGQPIYHEILGVWLRLHRRARAGGATSPCKRGEGRNPPGKTLGDDSPALDHPGASLQKEHSPTGCSPKAKGPTPALGQWHGPQRDTVVPAEDQGTCQPPTDPLGQPRTNWWHWSFHMPALSVLDPQGSNEYFRF